VVFGRKGQAEGRSDYTTALPSPDGSKTPHAPFNEPSVAWLHPESGASLQSQPALQSNATNLPARNGAHADHLVKLRPKRGMHGTEKTNVPPVLSTGLFP